MTRRRTVAVFGPVLAVALWVDTQVAVYQLDQSEWAACWRRHSRVTRTLPLRFSFDCLADTRTSAEARFPGGAGEPGLRTHQSRRNRFRLFRRLYRLAEGQDHVGRCAGRCCHRENGLAVGLEDLHPMGHVGSGVVQRAIIGNAQSGRQECGCPVRRLAPPCYRHCCQTGRFCRSDSAEFRGRSNGQVRGGLSSNNLPEKRMLL